MSEHRRVKVAHPAGMALLALTAVVVLAMASMVQAAFSLAATTYMTYFLKGTQAFGHSDSDQEVTDRQIPWIIAMTGAAPPEPMTVVNYPARFWPVSDGGLSDPTFGQSVAAGVAALPSPQSVEPGTVIAGGSQGAVVASLYKRRFNQGWANDAKSAPDITFVLDENPMRPNGGILERLAPLGILPIFDIPFYGAAPTQTAGADPGEITTYDISAQYNVFSDFPTNPLFILSDINALTTALPGPTDSSGDVQNAVLQDEYGDTRYYLIPVYPVPILIPLQRIPTVGPILVDMLDPTVRLWVEAGYDRTASPGQPTPANPLYFPNPVALAHNLLLAIPTGLDNGSQDVTGVRPFGTPRPDVMGQGAYGINAPPVTRHPTTDEQQTTPPLLAAVPSNTHDLTVPTSIGAFTISAADIDTANPPTTNPARPNIRGPIGSNLRLNTLTPPSPRSVFNELSTRTTSALSGAATPTHNPTSGRTTWRPAHRGEPPHMGSPSYRRDIAMKGDSGSNGVSGLTR